MPATLCRQVVISHSRGKESGRISSVSGRRHYRRSEDFCLDADESSELGSTPRRGAILLSQTLGCLTGQPPWFLSSVVVNVVLFLLYKEQFNTKVVGSIPTGTAPI